MLAAVRRFLLVLVLLGSAAPLSAQPEVVPAEHPIYPFLLAQRVAGRLPEYRHETLPHDRATLRRLLDSLDARRDALSTPARRWLATYRQEFFEPEDAVESILGPGGVRLPTFTGNEQFLYHYRNDEWRIALRALGRVQYRLAEDSVRATGLAAVPEGILEGNFRGVVGLYTGTFNGQQFGGDTRALAADPELAPLFYVARRDPPQGSFDRSTVSLRAAHGLFSAELAHERLRYGPSVDQPILLSDNADYVDFLRLGVEGRHVQYQFVHAALGDRVTVQRPENIPTAPERYLALHRVAVFPSRAVSLAFTEMVVYGLRGPELAYLNPLYPIKPAEHALWDRDNSLFALDAVLRPVAGLEAYGTYLVDDVDVGLIGEGAYGYKWGIQGGAALSLDRVLPGVTAFAEYTRLEPFLYTHRFETDGSFYNSYTHNGFGLGHPLGPNSDQWLGGFEVLLPARTHLRASGRYVRRGENLVGEEGEIVNVGGDVTNGAVEDPRAQAKRFLAGEVFEGLGGSLTFSAEPVRGLAFLLHGDYQRWNRDTDRLFLRGEVRVTL